MKTILQYILLGCVVFFSTLIILSLLFDQEDPILSEPEEKIAFNESEIPWIKPPVEEVVLESPEDKLEVYEPIFQMSPISDEVFERIQDISYKDNPHITLDQLRYLTMSYYDFDGLPQTGEMIVNHQVAEEVLEIFEILYDHQYPIDRMALVDEYNGDDVQSMAANNTSAFNYRLIAGTEKLSNHAFGLAIDINPMQNPYLFRNTIQPLGSETFLDREVYQQGMILSDDICYTAFIERGWTWGGAWTSVKDYQHFEKKLE